MQLEIKNFRSIQGQTVDLAPITVVYGPNGAGKSSLLYTLFRSKNVILNSNQASSGFFNFVFASLGAFEAVVFSHIQSNIELSLTVETQGLTIRHGVSFNEKQGTFRLAASDASGLDFSAELAAVPFPYPANQQSPIALSYEGQAVTLTWNGITAQVQAAQLTPEAIQTGTRLAAYLNAPAEVLRKVGVVPLKRGFSKPFYQTQPLSSMLVNEEEVATV